jgi:uncharacterized protein YggE
MPKSFAFRLFLAASVLSTIALPSFSAIPKDDDIPPSVTVIGNGRVKAKPDEASLQMGVVTQGKTASEALAANNTAMAALMNTLREQGIQERDVQTANFSVFPEYRREPPTPTETRMPSLSQIDSYRVSNEVRVRIRQTTILGKLLDSVVKNGANNIHGVSFTFSNPEALLSEARAKAIADAKRKATEYANAAEIKIGKAIFIDEQANMNQPYMIANSGMATMNTRTGDAVSIASGEQELSTTVTVVYRIE